MIWVSAPIADRAITQFGPTLTPSPKLHLADQHRVDVDEHVAADITSPRISMRAGSTSVTPASINSSRAPAPIAGLDLGELHLVVDAQHFAADSATGWPRRVRRPWTAPRDDVGEVVLALGVVAA